MYTTPWIAFILILGFTSLLLAADYHLDSATGDDANDGLSPEKAWKTLAAANKQIYQPGDKLLLKSGTTYIGQLAPRGSGAIVDGKPVLIYLGKYGEGPLPRIDGQGEVLDTLMIRNIDYWEICDLEITNTGEKTAPWRAGVLILADGYAMKSIHLNGLYVHDVNGDLHKDAEGCGIYFESEGGKVACFDDLIIENCHVVRTDRNGICQCSHGGASRSTRVVIRHNLLEDIGGDGIKLWGTNGGLIEHNTIHGGRMRCHDAAAGIWPFACDDTLIQYNEVSGMKGTNDGQGFDSDYLCSNSIFQYNYSHDNEGGFILVCAPGDSYCENTIIRYNISQNDGINSARVFHFGGHSSNTLVHNNIIYIGKNQSLPLFKFTDWNGGSAKNTRIVNNIFYVDGKVTYDFGKSSRIVFDHNIFYGHHENAPKDDHAITTQPLLDNPGTGRDGMNTLLGYLWKKSASPPRGAAIVDNATTDFFGNKIPTDIPPNLGIHETR